MNISFPERLYEHNPGFHSVRIFKLFSGLLFLSLYLLGFSVASAQSLDVNAVRFGTHENNKTRMVVELSSISDFRTFVLPDPSRLVIDLRRFNWQAQNITSPRGSIVSSVRNGILEPGVSRIVVDLTQNVLIQSAFLLPASGGAANRLVIDFKPAGVQEYARHFKTVHGTLKTSAPSFNLQTADPSLAPRTNINSASVPRPTQKPPSSGASRTPTQKPIIVIDAGHGGRDSGAVGANNLLEKNISLAATRELKRQLEATGRYRVKLTRSDDTFIRLSHRVRKARQMNGDLFISVHADSINKPNVRGASVYTLSDTASDAQTARLAARENKADLIEGVDLTMRDTMNQSKFFANTVVSHMQKSRIKMLPNPHRYAGFAVLKAPDIPSVLVEIGFMSNAAEVRKLSTPAYRQTVARALTNSIDAYFETVQKNNKM